MEPMSSSNPDIRKVVAAEVEGFGRFVDEISAKVDTLEKRVNEVERFYLTIGSPQLTNSKGSSIVKDKQLNLLKKQQQDASYREVTATKRMQELMRQFASIFRPSPGPRPNHHLNLWKQKHRSPQTALQFPLQL